MQSASVEQTQAPPWHLPEPPQYASVTQAQAPMVHVPPAPQSAGMVQPAWTTVQYMELSSAVPAHEAGVEHPGAPVQGCTQLWIPFTTLQA